VCGREREREERERERETEYRPGAVELGSILRRPGTGSLEKLAREAPRSGPLFDDLARAKSAKELKEHLETRVL
jgi:hypothetical protein